MKTLSDIRYHFHRNLPLLIGVFLCLYFSFHTLFGQRSYAQFSTLSSVLQKQSVTLETLSQEKTILARRVRMMRPASLSADMVEERARFILAYQLEDELAVFIP